MINKSLYCQRVVRALVVTGVCMVSISAIGAPPSNDDCGSPKTIQGTGVFPFDLREATTGTQGQFNIACELGTPPEILNDVWFCWTATCTGTVIIETCGLTTVNTKIALYAGCACPPTGAEPLCCNDDACGKQSRITCPVECGQQYLIHLGQSTNDAGLPPGQGEFKITCEGEPCPPPGPTICKTWTTNADFQEGLSFNLHPTPAPDGCLVLDARPKTWPTIGVAVSHRGTLVRVAVDNSLPGYSAGDVMGEYLTAPDGRQRNPSRTTVDAYGNIWVTNRDEGDPVNNVPKGSVARIGLVIGGTRGDKVTVGAGFIFVPNPAGEYLKGPFVYNTCDDRDGDGLIHTSRGYPWVNGVSDYVQTYLPWSNSGNADSAGGVSTAMDEAITAYVRVAGTAARFIAIDPAGDVWTGGLGNRLFEKLSGATAQPISGTVFNSNCGGYGGLVDPQDQLWSAQAGSTLMKYQAPGGPLTCIPNIPNYGVGIDPQTCHIWVSALTGNQVREIDPATNAVLATYGHGHTSNPNGWAQGLVVDDKGNVWVAHSLYGTTVGRLTTSGLFIGNVALGLNPSNAPGSGATGVAVDSNGKVWSANYGSRNAMRIDPSNVTNGPAGSVDLVVDLGPDPNPSDGIGGPYNYSDMTGSVLLTAVAPQGSWTTIYDSGQLNADWSSVSWNAVSGPNTTVTVQVRASNSPVPSGPWTTVTNNQNLTGLVGRYLQVRVTLARRGCTDGFVALCDLTVCYRKPCMEINSVSVKCEIAGNPPQWTGNFLYTYNITNNSGVTAYYMLLPNVPTTPHVVPLIPPLPNGQTRQVTIKLSGLQPHQTYCFHVILADYFIEECCNAETCITLPDCECFQVPTWELVCDPANPGTVLLSFTLQNLTPEVIEHMFVIPEPFGSGVIVDPDYVDVPSLAPFATQSFGPFAISGLGDASEFCLRISIHDELLELLRCCCSRVVCFDVPDCLQVLRGDTNCDGSIDFGDIDPFVSALSGQQAYLRLYPDCQWSAADANGDGLVNFADIDPFVALLGG